jgi:sarcosine oxidase subunit alpha
MMAAGIELVAIVDARTETRAEAPRGVRWLKGHVATRALGARTVRSVLVAPLGGGSSNPERIECDLLCVSGGWNPTVHLHAQARGRPVYDEAIASFVPGAPFQRERSAGAANGAFSLSACLAEGFAAGRDTAEAAGRDPGKSGPAPAARTVEEPAPIRAVWAVAGPGKKGKSFVDHQNDVTTDDLALAMTEGYGHVELLKRYTTLGMGTDQGRTSNVLGLAMLAGALDRDIPSVGTTTFRPPFVPITVGAFAGSELGEHLAPVRRSAIHGWHEQAGAEFVNAGLWRRPAYYPRPGEAMWDAIFREARAVRQNVGMVDVSTLGKIDIQGRDAAEFLDRIYINGWQRLPVGRCRYGVMLREDGVVFDDGTTSRLGDHHYLMTTTSANGAHVLRHLEFLLQVVWPELDVHLVSATEEWTMIALAGPDSRRVLERLTHEIDVSNEALPFMGVCTGTVAGVSGRIFRISFSGELAYEIAVPADYGLHLWSAMLEAGGDVGLAPYGTEAMNILRIEKGHVTGGELNGRTSADDLGFGRMLSREKAFIGKRSLGKPALIDESRRQLVGLVPVDGKTRVPRGAQVVADPNRAAPNPIEGDVTSTCYSPNLERPLALGLLSRGRARLGQRVWAVSPLRGEAVEVEVAHPVFVDPEGRRLHG